MGLPTHREDPATAMWYALYNALLFLGFPVVLVVLLIKRRCRSGLRQRLGWVVPRRGSSDERVLWIHAVSLGEVSAIVPLAAALHRRHPGVKLVVSTVTDTGREAVERHLAGMATHCFLPLDYPWMARRFVESLNPMGFVVVETELWPNILREIRRRGIPSVIVNGRLSSRSFSGYKRIRPFMRRVLAMVSLGLLQSRRDERRFVELGAAADRMRTTGNMKFDLPAGDATAADGVDRSALGLLENERLIVAGSTHPSEEVMLLKSYRAVTREAAGAVLLLAPRHIERSDEMERAVRDAGFPVTRWSRMRRDGGRPGAGGPRVILLDTRGDLARIYGAAAMAFVGGTLAPIGGHNLLEPAAWGTPVCFGPHTDHCQDIAELFVETGGGIRVRNVRELTDALLKGLRDRAWASRVGQCARNIIDDHRGVVEHNMHLIEELVGLRGF